MQHVNLESAMEGGGGNRPGKIGWALLVVSILGLGVEMFRGHGGGKETFTIVVTDAQSHPKATILEGPGGAEVRGDAGGRHLVPEAWRGRNVMLRESESGGPTRFVVIPDGSDDPVRLTW